MTASTPSRWQHLGALLIQRRTALSPRYHNRRVFSEATGLQYRLIYDIEEARRTNFGSSTLAAIEAAYQLAQGSITGFLHGGELAAPEAAARTRQRSTPGLTASTAEIARTMDRYVDVINARIAVARPVYPGQPLTGEQVFPDWPVARMYWNGLAEEGLEQEKLPAGVAMALTLDWRDEQGGEGGSAAG